jgi:hypothetical protein
MAELAVDAKEKPLKIIGFEVSTTRVMLSGALRYEGLWQVSCGSLPTLIQGS